jgi:uncharacterized protein DUF3417
MTLSPSSFLPPLPEGLEDLTELALDLKWSWSHGTDALWERIDPELWAQTRNPWLLLQSVGESKLRGLAAEGAHRAALRAQAEASRMAREGPRLVPTGLSGAAPDRNCLPQYGIWSRRGSTHLLRRPGHPRRRLPQGGKRPGAPGRRGRTSLPADSLLVGSVLPRKVHDLAAAALFRNPLIARFLVALGVIPVYGAAANFLPYYLPGWLAQRMAHTQTDYATIRLLASVVAFPLFWSLAEPLPPGDGVNLETSEHLLRLHDYALDATEERPRVIRSAYERPGHQAVRVVHQFDESHSLRLRQCLLRLFDCHLASPPLRRLDCGGLRVSPRHKHAVEALSQVEPSRTCALETHRGAPEDPLGAPRDPSARSPVEQHPACRCVGST